jgi:hypothetical protein
LEGIRKRFLVRNRIKKLTIIKRKRFDIKKILSDPMLRKEIITQTIIATQSREGVETTIEQAERAYFKVRKEVLKRE